LRNAAFGVRGTSPKGDPRERADGWLPCPMAESEPAACCAWCGDVFDASDERMAGRVRCSRCGVATTSPWPSDAQLKEAYDGWYRPAGGRFAGLGDAVLRRTRSSLARRVDTRVPPGPILDVGAGDGTLVTAFVRRGREAVGLEPHASGPRILNAEVQDVEGEYSAVIFWHSLEHLRQPAAALRHAAELVVPGGLVVISVPNAVSWQARIFGDRWHALDVPRHLVHLSPQALLSTIGDLGLHVERVSYLRGGQVVFGWVHGLVGQLPGHPDLYDVIRRKQARRTAQGPLRRLFALAAAVVALPLALAATAIEVAATAGGTIYVEARRNPAGSRRA